MGRFGKTRGLLSVILSFFDSERVALVPTFINWWRNCCHRRSFCLARYLGQQTSFSYKIGRMRRPWAAPIDPRWRLRLGQLPAACLLNMSTIFGYFSGAPSIRNWFWMLRRCHQPYGTRRHFRCGKQLAMWPELPASPRSPGPTSAFVAVSRACAWRHSIVSANRDQLVSLIFLVTDRHTWSSRDRASLYAATTCWRTTDVWVTYVYKLFRRYSFWNIWTGTAISIPWLEPRLGGFCLLSELIFNFKCFDFLFLFYVRVFADG